MLLDSFLIKIVCLLNVFSKLLFRNAALVLIATVSTCVSVHGQVGSETPPVHYSKLLPFLPEAPSGWTLQEPMGVTNLKGFKSSRVSCGYTKGGGDKAPSIIIQIFDAAHDTKYHDKTIQQWKDHTESTDGYRKPVTIQGYPGSEWYSKSWYSNSSEVADLSLLIGQRFFVEISLFHHQGPESLQEWIKRIDLKKLAELK